MDKSDIIEKIKNKDYTEEKLIAWIQCIPGSSATRKPTKTKIGDVFVHPVFRHPYVVIGKKKKDYICVLMTTESSFEGIIEPCNSRFFPGNYFTSTVFKTSEIAGAWANTFDNPKQLTKIREIIKEIFS